MTVYVSGSFDVDLYVDVNGQWVSGDRGSEIVWDFGEQQLSEDKGLKTWKIRRETEQLLSEVRDQAEWGTLHFSAPLVGLTHTFWDWKIADWFRMFVTSLGCLDFSAHVSHGQGHCRILSMTTSVALWKRSLSLLSPNPLV